MAGVHKFQQEIFGLHKKLFTKLAKRQAPHTLFITCSDSRISPSMLTQTEPGEIFILRNAGNIVPEYSEIPSGEAATVEFAIIGLGIENIVVCGHSNCGAMQAVLDPKLTESLPALRAWLSHTENTHRTLEKSYADRSANELLNIAVQENVLTQLENLRTHPAVRDRITQGKLHLYGWVYKISTGEVFSYDFKDEQFRPLAEANRAMRHADQAADDNKFQM